MSDKLNSGNPEKISTQTANSGMSGRRSFLKKSATGAVIMSLPAKSVWGACSVSGAMSGNLSQNTNRHDCTAPILSGGRSPGTWHHSTLPNIHSVFSNYKSSSESCKESIHKAINEVKGTVMQLPSELVDGGARTVQSGLSDSGSVFWHLGAAYLNAYFGLYGGQYQGHAGAQALVNQLFLYIFMQLESNPGFDVESVMGYTDGTTEWVPLCSDN